MTDANKASRKTDLPEAFDQDGIYEIEIKELLEDHWGQWFEGMALIRVEDVEAHRAFTLLRGAIPDQPALHGLLARIRDLNLTLVSVRQIDPNTGQGTKSARRSHP